VVQVTFAKWQALILLGLFPVAHSAAASEGVLSDNQRISSIALGYDLHYRIYRPASTSADERLPSLYVTDGQWYLEQGDFKSVLDKAISTGLIKPVLVVFLDSRNPDKLTENRRTQQFMCSTEFAEFFATELIPAISKEQSVSLSRNDRVILGLSFGGLNSACFGLMLSNLFAGIAMQSPASADHVDVVSKLYAQREALPLKMFLSVGTKNDNLSAAKRFKRVLESKGYNLTYITVREGHDWRNWGPLLDDVLVAFFSSRERAD
jgi:enterochelin esterase-like enzyme